MEARPDIDSLCCMNEKCKYFKVAKQGQLRVRKIYGQDQLRYLRCSHCSYEFSERRGSALFNTKITEAKAENVIDHLRQGCGFRATVALTGVCKAHPGSLRHDLLQRKRKKTILSGAT